MTYRGPENNPINKDEIFDKLIDDALESIARQGVENVSDKQVTIACVAILARNSIEALTCEVGKLTSLFKKIAWGALSIILGLLVAVAWGYIVLLTSGAGS